MMGNPWKDYPNEKKQAMLLFLELRKKQFSGEKFELAFRETFTRVVLEKFPYLTIPQKQFGGSFEHHEHGFFPVEEGYQVTESAIKKEANSRGIAPEEYVTTLIRDFKIKHSLDESEKPKEIIDITEDAAEPQPPDEKSVTITQKIRDTKIISDLKKIYANKCQICNLSIKMKNCKEYSEGHHL